MHVYQITREVLEGYYAIKRAALCISELSVTLHKKEFWFLDRFCVFIIICDNLVVCHGERAGGFSHRTYICVAVLMY